MWKQLIYFLCAGTACTAFSGVLDHYLFEFRSYFAREFYIAGIIINIVGFAFCEFNHTGMLPKHTKYVKYQKFFFRYLW
ncbi:hypothetical protein A3A69_00510 [candidate division WWE3 bacterium RIFCSPLOWO2_01_FULL_37_15]|uniref:Uncharacterized protein n=1 Tax=candidate division WWE3 bacterium RIFCSPLOWO2_01_FULL_37_15 TaxID=1802622 RepID=A0A1F4UV09_UNCKA|nr:MAG: hypothetical protein A3A69_00510 [candidate division WWE3 bacterium RIFCSPLOWO2_01_FULL_37_15]